MEVVSRYKAKLGEGPVYDIELNKLFWVDIEGKKILIKDLDNYSEEVYDTPDLVSSLCVISENEVIATIRHGIYIIDLKTKSMNKLGEVEVEYDENRFNDGKCDPLGRYWAGTMNMKKSGPTGSLYRIDLHGITRVLDKLIVSNGLGWSPDKDTMYLIDSPIRKVYAFDFDLNKGEIYNKRILIDFAGEPGNPDGMTVDEEGYLWIAHWGGGKISRWSPRGEKVFEIKLPVTYVTSVTFGGYELNRLFITTANKEDEPLSGKVFTKLVEIRGIPSYRFKKYFI